MYLQYTYKINTETNDSTETTSVCIESLVVRKCTIHWKFEIRQNYICQVTSPQAPLHSLWHKGLHRIGLDGLVAPCEARQIQGWMLLVALFDAKLLWYVLGWIFDDISIYLVWYLWYDTYDWRIFEVSKIKVMTTTQESLSTCQLGTL